MWTSCTCFKVLNLDERSKEGKHPPLESHYSHIHALFDGAFVHYEDSFMPYLMEHSTWNIAYIHIYAIIMGCFGWRAFFSHLPMLYCWSIYLWHIHNDDRLVLKEILDAQILDLEIVQPSYMLIGPFLLECYLWRVFGG